MFDLAQVSYRQDTCDGAGVEDSARIDQVADMSRKRCSTCGRVGHDRRSCGRLEKSKPFDPWSDLEWEEHTEAREIVTRNPGGMTLEEVGEVLGVTRERVRQIEAAAMKKLKSGIGLGEVVVVEEETIPVVICDRCETYFVRRARSKLCERCALPEASATKPKVKRSSARRVVAAIVVSEVRAVPILPPPADTLSEKDREGLAKFLMIFDFRGM